MLSEIIPAKILPRLRHAASVGENEDRARAEILAIVNRTIEFWIAIESGMSVAFYAL